MESRLFPVNLPELQWTEFQAEGFSHLVPGVIFRAGQSTCGVPLGGVGTGCMDLDTDGTLGRCSIFNSFVPHRVLSAPFLALTAGTQTWALTSRTVSGVGGVKQIHYWGHYPFADVEFELDGPVNLGVRAWSPFLPGDSAASNVPAAVFELHIRNQSTSLANGSVAFTFPGPTEVESGTVRYQHLPLKGSVRGVSVAFKDGCGYALGIQGTTQPRTGGDLSSDHSRWLSFAHYLPEPGEGPGASIAIDFELKPSEESVVPIILAWYVPRWAGSAAHHYLHAYQRRFANVQDVAEFVGARHTKLQSRIIAWQEEIYSSREYPAWLRDQLVNVLHTIPEDAFWAGESIPPETWYKSTGIFGMTESPRTTPHICNPSDWYGNLPIVFFFPDLAASLLRSYVHFQLPNGEIPIGIGEGADLAHPSYHVLHTMNSCVHVHLVDRLWQRDLNQAVLHEFYPSARKAINYAKGLDRDGDGLPDLEPDPMPNQFYGAWFWYGTAVHVNGFWLAALAMVERMAESIGDAETAHDCRIWRQQASRSLEEKLWAHGHYLLYNDPETGRKSDTVLANQLAGEWCARLHGLQGVFPPERVTQTLATIKRLCMPLTQAGLLDAARPDGSIDHSGSPQSDGIFTGECTCAVATMAYGGQAETALKIARRLYEAIVIKERCGWDMPNLLDSSGRIIHGTDFYQNMILWALPLALANQAIHEACSIGSLVARVLQAAQES